MVYDDQRGWGGIGDKRGRGWHRGWQTLRVERRAKRGKLGQQ